MHISEFKEETIVTAERGMYLKYKNEELTVDKVGKPERIIFSKKAIIPEFEELPLDFEDTIEKVEEEQVVEEDTTEKSTKKKSSK